MVDRGRNGFAVMFALVLLAGCVTPQENYGSNETVTIEYDPYDFDPADLLAEAQAHCGAYGLSAVFEDETADPQSVRWRYRHYRCY